MTYFDVTLETIIGPSHHFGGLSDGNIASMGSKYSISNPKMAALQSLDKLKLVASLGQRQLLLPPHPRPLTLKQSDIHRLSDHELSVFFSSGFMWTANSSTLISSRDHPTHCMHSLVANMITESHRQQEAACTDLLLRRLFGFISGYKQIGPLPSNYPDEGAANIMCFSATDKASARLVFVYGDPTKVSKYPVRQTLETCQAMVLRLGLSSDQVFFAELRPELIDMGVFHNDVISLNHDQFLLTHEEAYVNQDSLLNFLDGIPTFLVNSSQLSIEEAVSTYFFNSQFVLQSDLSLAMIVSKHCVESVSAHRLLEVLVSSSSIPISQFYSVNLSQSMMNGGGPACLRNRVCLTDEEWASIPPYFKFTSSMYDQLYSFIESNYPTSVTISSFREDSFYDRLNLCYYFFGNLFK